MKRKRDSVFPARASQRGNRAKEKVDGAESRELGPYFSVLPSDITTHILLQLPIKSLLRCRCVCSNWNALISDPPFAKLHFERAPLVAMIRTKDRRRVSRTLHLLEYEPGKFEIELDNHMKLDIKFKLPLRDAKSVLDKTDETRNGDRQRRYIACKPDDDKFDVVNSCNGLLCLCDPSNGNPLVVCNPVTGEFVRLPETTRIKRASVQMYADAGFGYQPKTNEYKVIRMWKRHVRHAHEWVFEGVVFEMHTLGTPTWMNVEVDPRISISRLKFPTCVNGALHWISYDGWQRSILCFNFESERFQSFPSPPHVFESDGIHGTEDISMGELRGFLYICDISFSGLVIMCVMKKYGIGESWTKVYSINTFCRPDLPYGKGAAILVYHSCNRFIYYEPGKYELKFFQIHGTRSKLVEVIPHIPSLISLKDAVKRDNIEVLNVHSRCAKFKLREENEVLFLAQDS